MAKWVGDLFNGGIYDTHIELKKTPFLEWELTKQQDELVASHVTSPLSKLSYVFPITRVCCIEKLLCTTTHSAFPVVTPIKASSFPSLLKNSSNFSPQLYTVQSQSSAPTTPTSRRRKSNGSSGGIKVRSPVLEEMKSVGGISKACSGTGVSYNLPLHDRTCECILRKSWRALMHSYYSLYYYYYYY